MAILMAGLMTVLIIVAAMGVDLGNAWQRKMTVQKSVDVSAISAGHLLPKTSTNTDAIYAEVATYFNKASNIVTAKPGTRHSGLSSHDNDVTNGEVTFDGRQLTMTVVAPQAHVDYGLANVIGFDSVEVHAEATVQVRTPILPDQLGAADVVAGHVRLRTSRRRRGGEPGAVREPDLHAELAQRAYATTSGRSVRPRCPYATPAPVGHDHVIKDVPQDRTWAVIRFTFGNTQYVDYLVTFPDDRTA